MARVPCKTPTGGKAGRPYTLASRPVAHPFSLAIALFYAADLHQLRREERLTQERTNAAIALRTEQGFPDWLAVVTSRHGR